MSQRPASSVQRPASSVQRRLICGRPPAPGVMSMVALASIAGSVGTANAQEAWQPNSVAPGLISVFVEERGQAASVAESLEQLGLQLMATGKITGTMTFRCREGDEWLWTSLVKYFPGVRSVVQDRTGQSGFTIPPSEMPQPSGEPPSAWQLHDLWFLQNTGQEILCNCSPPATQYGTPGADINALNAWSITQGDSRVVLAIFDTGVDYEHPEFAGRLLSPGISYVCGPGWSAFHCCAGSPVVCIWGNATDNDGHGTAVAGVAAANVDNGTPSSTLEEQYAGVDPGCSILPVRISWGNIPLLSLTNYAFQDILASDRPYPIVISMSIFWAKNDQDPLQQELESLLDLCKGNNIVVVVASSNGGTGAADNFVPAAFDNVITVGASDMSDDGPAFSGTGVSVDFVAPGWGIYTAYCPASRGCHPRYADNYLPGTSASTPITAAVVTLLHARALDLSIELSWDDVYDLLKAGAVPLGSSPFPNEQFGWGRIDAYASLLEMEP